MDNLITWTQDYEDLLNDIRINSVHLARHHKKKYVYYKNVDVYFKLPTIILSSIVSVAAVSLSSYINQTNSDSIICLMSLSVSIINSIEIYLKISDNVELELDSSKKYMNLSTDIHMLLQLNKSNRTGSPELILKKFYERYIDLINNCNLINDKYPDKLLVIPKMKNGLFSIKIKTQIPTSSLSSNSNNSTSCNSSLSSNPINEEEETI